jgi:hypothetical protein
MVRYGLGATKMVGGRETIDAMERDMGRIEQPTLPVRVDDQIRWGLGCSRHLALSLAARGGAMSDEVSTKLDRIARRDSERRLIAERDQALRERDDARTRSAAWACRADAYEWQRDEALRERDEAKRQLELITSYRVRHREAIRKANAERDQARRVALHWLDWHEGRGHGVDYTTGERIGEWSDEDDRLRNLTLSWREDVREREEE